MCNGSLRFVVPAAEAVVDSESNGEASDQGDNLGGCFEECVHGEGGGFPPGLVITMTFAGVAAATSSNERLRLLLLILLVVV